jgi:RNA polymerase sigma-70 factor, ECF subfamily
MDLLHHGFLDAISRNLVSIIFSEANAVLLRLTLRTGGPAVEAGGRREPAQGHSGPVQFGRWLRMGKLSTAVLSWLHPRTDEEDMWRVKTREDHRAFTRLVARWERPIRRLCTRMVGDAHRGEDLTQEAFARLFDKRRHYEPSGRFSTYLWRLALNLCYDELRRTRRRQELLAAGHPAEEPDSGGESPADEPSPDAQTASHEEHEMVRRAVVRLPEIYRAVLVLRHYEGLKTARIAEILEVPEGTVHSRLAEALARLRRSLAPQLDRARPEARLESGESGEARRLGRVYAAKPGMNGCDC